MKSEVESDASDSSPSAEDRGERLQKVLAAAGVGSRRECEQLIVEGRVDVDGQVITVLGTRVTPNQQIRVDGEALRRPKRLVYAVYKPEGVVTTNADPAGRTLVIDLVPTQERVFAVGRLDRASEGLIIVTNDGELSNKITHPRFGVEKEYLVRIAGKLGQEELLRLRRGIHLAEGFAKVVSLKLRGSHGQSTDLEIVLNEGKNREIRRMLASVGHKVLSLKRIAIGKLRLGNMQPGDCRQLTNDDVKSLLTRTKPRKPKAAAAVGAKAAAAPGAARSVGEAMRPRKEQPPRFQSSTAPPIPDEPLELEDFLLPDDEEMDLEEMEEDGQDVDLELTGDEVQGGVIDYGGEDGGEKPARPRGKKSGPPRAEFIGPQRPPRGGERGRGGPRAGGPPGGRPAGRGSFNKRPGKFTQRPGRFSSAGEGGAQYGGEEAGGGERPRRPMGRRISGGRPVGGRTGGARPSGGRPSGGRPVGGRSGTGTGRGRTARPIGGRSSGPAVGGGGERSGGRPSGGRPSGGRPSGGRPSGGRPSGGRPSGGRPSGGRPSGGRPSGGRPSGGRPSGGRPGGGRPSGGRPSGGSGSGGRKFGRKRR